MTFFFYIGFVNFKWLFLSLYMLNNNAWLFYYYLCLSLTSFQYKCMFCIIRLSCYNLNLFRKVQSLFKVISLTSNFYFTYCFCSCIGKHNSFFFKKYFTVFFSAQKSWFTVLIKWKELHGKRPYLFKY